ncbi:hypothetical protein [Deinococcus altitudinis]|uniref:hypothetical protein n=1 Tax=Deinococcus altitudinis TaxID=468914 RepID=UPI00389256C1
MTDSQNATAQIPAQEFLQPEQPTSLPSGSQPSETGDGILWGPALPVEAGVRVTATYSDGTVATTDAKDQEAARTALRAYHTPKGA